MLKNTRLLAVLMASLLLGGCAVALVGGAAATGYVVGKDERSMQQMAKDTGIASSVKSALINDKIVIARSIDVDCAYSVIKLNGVVRSEAEKQQAIDIATAIEGVQEVISQLRVVPVIIEERN